MFSATSVASIRYEAATASLVRPWGIWLDGSGKTDWSQTHIHLETSAAFAVVYSAQHGAYAMYLGVDKGRPHPTPAIIRRLGISCIVEASEARPDHGVKNDEAAG